MGAFKFAIISIFAFLVSFSVASYSQELSSVSTQYPVYEGMCSDVKSFEEKIKLGSSYTKLSSQSGSIIEKGIWESQKQLRDEVYDAMGSYKISGTLLDEKIDLNGREYTLYFTPALHPQRLIRLVNSGRGTESVKTQYMVSDSMHLVNTLGFRTGLNDYLGLELMRGQSIIGVQKISYVNSLEDYNQDRPQGLLARYIDDSKSFDDYVKSQEKEQSRIFFKGFFDPYRVGKRFIKISAEKIKNDPTFRVGDIFIKNMVRKQGPGIGVSKDLIGASYNFFSYEELKIGLKKQADGIYLLKLQLEDGKNHDWDLIKVGVPVIAFKPQRTTYDSTRYVIAEKLYRLDLNNSQAAQQLDALLNKHDYAKSIKPADYYNELLAQLKPIPGAVDELFEKTRQSLNPQTAFRNKTELGFFGLRVLNSQSTESSVLQPTEGEASEHVVGEVQRYTSKRTRLAFKESNEDTKRKFRVLSRKLPSGSLETDLGFEYAFDDSKTKVKEYFRYLNDINHAFFMDKHIQGTQAQEISDLLKDRLANKSDKKDQQAVSAAIYFSQKFVRKIASHSQEDVQKLLALIILGNGKSWADLEKLKIGCRDELNPDYKDAIINVIGKSCNKILSTAQLLVDMFNISKKEKYATVVQQFAELVHDQKMKSFIPMMMLQIGLLNGFDSLGAPSFESLDEAFKNGDVEMSLAFVGDGINGIIYKQIGDVVTLAPAEFEGDFPLHTPVATSPLIIKSEVATDGSKIYVQFDSLTKSQPEYVLKGIAAKYRMIRNDQPEALFKVSNLTSTDMIGSNGKVSFYRYVIELPMIPELQNNSDSTFQFWIEDGAGVRVTEPFSVKFKL